jgi:hypothetical protein
MLISLIIRSTVCGAVAAPSDLVDLTAMQPARRG